MIEWRVFQFFEGAIPAANPVQPRGVRESNLRRWMSVHPTPTTGSRHPPLPRGQDGTADMVVWVLDFLTQSGSSTLRENHTDYYVVDWHIRSIQGDQVINIFAARSPMPG